MYYQRRGLYLTSSLLATALPSYWVLLMVSGLGMGLLAARGPYKSERQPSNAQASTALWRAVSNNGGVSYEDRWRGPPAGSETVLTG